MHYLATRNFNGAIKSFICSAVKKRIRKRNYKHESITQKFGKCYSLLIQNNDICMRHAGYACGPKIDPRISLSNTLISLDLTTRVDSLFLFLLFFLPWSRGSCRVTGCCHGGCLSSSLTSPTLYYHTHTHAHSFARRTKEDNELLHRCNQPSWLEETTASKMILAYPCVYVCHV